MVGDGDGFAEREGFKDGESLGFCDGLFVGSVLGLAETLGRFDGCKVGTKLCVGLLDGTALGVMVGPDDGLDEGLPLG